MGKIRINQDGELTEPGDHLLAWQDDAFHEDSARDPSVSSVAAAGDAFSSILTLLSNSHRGEKYALESLLLLARQLCEILNDQNNEVRFEGDARENWDDLVKAATEWPVMMPAETNRQEAVLAKVNLLPIGESVGYKLYKKHLGHGKPPGEPAKVALGVMMSISRIRNQMLSDPPGRFSDEELAVIYRDLPASLISKIRILPTFSRDSLPDWKNVVAGFIEIPEKRRLFIPDRWKEDALNGGKGYMAHVRNAIFSELNTICLPQNPLEAGGGLPPH